MRGWKRFRLVLVAAIAVMASPLRTEEDRKIEAEQAKTAQTRAPSPGKRRADAAALPKIDLPPPPEGVTDLALGEVFKPPGRRGLEYTEKAKGLHGKRVRILGYMVDQDRRHPGLLTTSDVFDATPAAWASHTQSRAAGTGICDQYLDESHITNLRVCMGGGRKWFLPNTTPGSARAASSDYVLPADLASAWNVPAGQIDPGRDLLAGFIDAGWTYAADTAELAAVPDGTARLLGLFSLSNMNVALDKIDGRRGDSTVVHDYGLPDQPMLDEMTEKALEVLSRNDGGFVLMVEAASIDKQAHNMDTERWILDTIEFDRAVDVCLDFAEEDGDTLVVVTADHECAGINIIGGSRVTDADLAARAATGLGASQVRNGVVGTYESAGFLATRLPRTATRSRRMWTSACSSATRRTPTGSRTGGRIPSLSATASSRSTTARRSTPTPMAL